jgi:prepilin-type N-terminal cleavage/methylation domain-containing protein
MRTPKNARRGFSLIELLVVIAIIAILAALIFPTFNRARESVRQTNCMSQMHDISVALKLYREDNNKYPAALLGFAQDANGQFFTGAGQAVPIDEIKYRPLTNGQKYLKAKELFICPDSTHNDPTPVTVATYPLSAGSNLAGKQVTFSDVMVHNIGPLANSVQYQPVYFYEYDSYDTGPMVDADGKQIKDTTELHYSLDWTNGGDPDNPNQLKYPNPSPDSTVVTWCTYHAAVAHGNMIPVLFLSGNVKPIPVDQFFKKGPLGF